METDCDTSELDIELLSIDLNKALSTLTEKERNVIKMFYGIGCQGTDVNEISFNLGFTVARINQIKKKALHKLAQGAVGNLLRKHRLH